MNTAVITAKTDIYTKRDAQKLAQDLGLPLSSVVNALLKQFVRTKSLNLSLDEGLQLSDWAEKNLKQSKNDLDNGDYYEFDNIDDAVSFLDHSNLEKLDL